MLKYSLSFLLFLLSIFTHAQESNPCVTYDAMDERYTHFPSEKLNSEIVMEQIFSEAEKSKKHRLKNEEKYIIPTVFHVVHDYGKENISDEQIKSAIEWTNKELTKQNEAAADIHPAFADIAANANIELRLATTDPHGNCTRGIVRYHDHRTYSGNDTIKFGRQWPAENYLNVYVVGSIGIGIGGAAGYAYYPGNSRDIDGIVMLHSYVGYIGTGDPRRASTLTHEVGHYLALPHTWGSTNEPEKSENCEMDDEIDDTPLTIGNRTCDLDRHTCGSLDNVQNFMEYSYCYSNFTEGQKAVMRTTLNSSRSGRSTLVSQENLIATGTNDISQDLCLNDFKLQSRVNLCAGSPHTFKDLSYHNIASRKWHFEGGVPEFSTESEPTVNFPNPGLYQVILEVSTEKNSGKISKASTVKVLQPKALPYFENLEGIRNLSTSLDFEVINDGDDAVTWTLNKEIGNNSPHSIYLPNSKIDDPYLATDELVTAPVYISGMKTIYFEFDYAFTNYTGNISNDELTVYFSVDCGSTWHQTAKLRSTDLVTASPIDSGQIFTPATSEEWKKITVDVQNRGFEWMRFKIHWQNTYKKAGSDIYLDNFHIFLENEGFERTGVNNEERKKPNYSLFPNPAKEKLTIKIDGKQTGDFQIFNLQGELIKTVKNPGRDILEVNVKNIKPGVYLTKFTSKMSSRFQKIVIN